MDDIDRINEREERVIEYKISTLPKPTPFTGTCLNCEYDITIGHFCDADCRDDYEREQLRQR